jgi:hypothetical protein
MDLLESHLNHSNLQGLEDLLNYKKININGLVSKYRTSPLYHFICNITKIYNSITKDDYEIVKLLINHNADVNYIWRRKNVLSLLCNSHGNTSNRIDIIQLLLDNKISANDPSLKYPVIKYAIDTNNWKIVKLLLKNKIEISHSAISQYNHWTDHEYSVMTKLLLEYISPNILPFIISYSKWNVLLILCNYGCLNNFKHLMFNPDLFKSLFGEEFNANYVYISDFDIYPFMRLHTCDARISKYFFHSSLLRIVTVNIHEFKNYNCHCRNDILGDGKDLNNYIEIAKILIILGADVHNIEIPDVLKLYIIEVKNTLCEYLLHFLPKVLVNVIIDYMFNLNDYIIQKNTSPLFKIHTYDIEF